MHWHSVFAAAFVTVAVGFLAPGQTRSVVDIEFRLIDDISAAGLPAASSSIRIDSASVRPVSTDTSSLYRLLVPLSDGTHRLSIRRIGYSAHTVEFRVQGDTLVNLGTVRLRPFALGIIADPIPWCELIREKPATLRAGSWLVAVPDSARQKRWILCSLDRPPR